MADERRWPIARRRSLSFRSSGGRGALVSLLLLSLPSIAFAQDTAQPVPPEVQRTVDAFVGHWTITGSSTEPGSTAPSRVTGTMDCEPTAGGVAVRCRVVNAVPDGGRIEIATILGYSPDDRRVHLMEAASPGLYHEHRGSWKGTTIRFDRMTKTVGGQRIVEDFAVGFPSSGRMTITSTERTAAGRSTLDLTGLKDGGR